MSAPGAVSRPVSPWLWVPTLYFAQGLPNGLLEDVAPVLLKDVGVDNEHLTRALAYAAVPWMLKALWSPLVDGCGLKRTWVWAGQAVCAVAFALVALLPQAGVTLAPAVGLLALVALASATHDIAADGFYLLGVPTEGERSFFSGIRNTAFRLAKVFAAGAIVVLAGRLIHSGVATTTAWSIALGVLAAVVAVLALWHAAVLPRPADDRPAGGGRESPVAAFLNGWKTFFQKPGIVRVMAFILLFRLAESLVSIIAVPFLKDPVAAGGLGLDTEKLGWMSTLGVVALLAGGVLGGMLVSRTGLRRVLWPMVLVMHLPNLAFLALAHWQPQNLPLITGALLVEKFGYGFGFCAFMLYLLYVCTGERRVTHYAICSGFMLLGGKLPGLWAGQFQQAFGYEAFFILVLLTTLPGFLVTALVSDLPEHFGRKQAATRER